MSKKYLTPDEIYNEIKRKQSIKRLNIEKDVLNLLDGEEISDIVYVLSKIIMQITPEIK